jgi:histidine triad (HIT) family protein
LDTKSEFRSPTTIKLPQQDCVFCAIASGKAQAYIVYKQGEFICFLDKYPFTRGHVLVSPLGHYQTVWDMPDKLVGDLFSVATKISKAVVKATDADGFRFVQNNGEAASQVIPHVHIHVIPVKNEERGRFMSRKAFTPQEQEEIATKISRFIAGMRSL